MDIDLRLPSGENEKEEKEEAKEMSNMMDGEHKMHSDDVLGRDMVGIRDKLPPDSDGGVNSPSVDMVDFKEDINLEPIAGMEFESHGEAYSFYQEYARSMGFSTAIQNSRRSKTSREFIDAKFACSRYGTKREHDKSFNRPRSRQGSNQDPENASGRRSCSKTDCKASMHVKRRPDGKWIIHRFEKEHNHELLPAQAVSEQTRKMYAAMARQFAEYKNVVGLKNDSNNPFEKGLACMPKKEAQEDMIITFRVSDFEKSMDFNVTYNESTTEVSCMCRLFEFKGFLCRHAMIVLQICGLSAIPSQYILKRWTKDVKNRCLISEGPEQVQYRVQRYNDLCQRAIKLGEEGSLSQESYNMALRALEDVYANCVCLNNSNKNLIEAGTSTAPGVLRIEEDNQSRNMRTNKKKNPMKKRKVNSEQDIMTVGAQDSLQQLEISAATLTVNQHCCHIPKTNTYHPFDTVLSVKSMGRGVVENGKGKGLKWEGSGLRDKLSSRSVTLDGYFGPQQSMQGMVQLNLMAPSRENYYGNQQAIQGLGQLNSIAPNHESYYGAQPTLHGLEEPNVRTTQLHDDGSRHA
ncbi:FAR1 DNA binding domain-containing protein [Cynara cardunculus var. scolymus]|uniref:Protein FAR1-RELATED SEQUENCE n=1 Tax=Cynara cardunculus var. scolymus TaxID=59895 RepID=A0A124SG47_CYNCS|nr:FAR1 DNA binding domain-containing protein [Cynara cardunculus var. scolymus]